MVQLINDIKFDLMRLEDFAVPQDCVIAELALDEIVKNGVKLAPVHNILKITHCDFDKELIGRYIIAMGDTMPLEVKIRNQSWRPVNFCVRANDIIFVDVERYFAKNKINTAK